MIERLFVCLVVAVIVGEPAARVAAATSAPEMARREPYTWRNIAMGGGGYITGIALHPSERNLVYVRTDVGGAYRFSATADALGRNWIPLTDHFSLAEWNYYGIESIALDANDPDVVYLAAGKYDWAGTGRLFRSDNRGQSWKPLPLELPMAANGSYRWGGERLAVDPQNGRRVYFGSRTAGLWISEDCGEHWKQVKTLPAQPHAKAGVIFVLPDPYVFLGRDPAPVYAALYGVGIASSEDAGKSWRLIGGPKEMFRGAVAPDRTLYVTGPEGLFRYRRKQWSDIAPARGAQFSAVAADPNDASTVMVGEAKFSHSLALYLTHDRGERWEALSQSSGELVARPNVPWWSRQWFPSATSALAFDPHISGRLWLTEWYGTWFTDNHRARPMAFRTLQRGQEEIVVMTLSTPPSGAWLLSGVQDNNGFRHEAIDAFPERRFPTHGFWNTHGIDYNEENPNFMVRVGTKGSQSDKADGGVDRSSDNGRTWEQVPWPFGAAMKVAYSARERDLFVVLPLKGAPKRTTDGGKTWEESLGIEGSAIKSYWHWNHPLAADRVRGRSVYLYADGVLYRSEDGGLNWAKGASLPKAADHYLEAEPGKQGYLWISLGEHGLYRSTDGGASFQRIPTVKSARLFSLGRPMLPSDTPTLFLYGIPEHRKAPGIFRSDDLGEHWTEIGDPALPIGDEPNIMRGDRQNAGRVYIGTNGRGIFVGMPAR